MRIFEVETRWLPIKGWPYEVSEDGRVRNLQGQEISSWEHTGKGVAYLRVTLRDKDKRWNPRIHRLVAAAFLPNPENLPEVDHTDDNSFNNHYTNLEWVTSAENIKRRGSNFFDYY